MSFRPKLDPRAERSREWMRNALLQLIQEKGYQRISISEITDRAGLSRPTFYLHYKSKDDILIECLVRMYECIMEEFSENIRNAGTEQPGLQAMKKLFQAVRQNADIFRLVSKIGAEQILRQNMVEGYFVYLEDLASRYGVAMKPEIHQLSAHYLAGATVGVIYSWLEQENPPSPDQIGEFMWQNIIAYLRFAIREKRLDFVFPSSSGE